MLVTVANVQKVLEIAQSIGLEADLFRGWDGGELALYQDTSASSASLEVALAVAREKSRLRLWVLDLGNKAVSLSRSQGEQLKAKLDEAGIEYASESVGDLFLRRRERVARDHQEILRELAKR